MTHPVLDTVLHREPNADSPRYVASDVAYLLDRFVNVCFVGPLGAGDRLAEEDAGEDDSDADDGRFGDFAGADLVHP